MNNRFVTEQKRFPDYVFMKKWDSLLFFDADWIFSPELMEFRNLMIRTGPIIITKLGTENSFYKISRRMKWEQFQAFIKGTDFNGWLYDFGRYLIFDNSNEWCIYAEREAEIAVFACQSNTYYISDISTLFKAVPIKLAVSGHLSAFATLHNQVIRQYLENY